MTISAGLLDIIGKPALVSTTDDVNVGSLASGGVAKLVGLGAAFDSTPRTGTAAALATGNTITPTAGVMRFAPGAAVTGAIIAAGSKDGQILTIVNESANTVDFAAIGTSRVLNGGGSVGNVRIAANSCTQFIWVAGSNSGTGSWVQVRSAVQ